MQHAYAAVDGTLHAWTYIYSTHVYYSVCHIAGEFARFLKHQIEEERYWQSGDSCSTHITNEEVLCLQIAGLCHDLG